MNRLALLFIFLVAFAATSFAQEKPDHDCGRLGDETFVGKSIDLDLGKTGLGQVLASITSQTGCYFILDNTVVYPPLFTSESKNVPWNTELLKLLESQGLGAMVRNVADSQRNIIYISTKEGIDDQMLSGIRCERQTDKSGVYTEFVKLKNVPACDNGIKRECERMVGKIMPKVRHAISEEGSLETDSRSRTVIITDRLENLSILRKLIESFDREDFYKSN